ncbi:MAG: PLP-dependent aminotransferase family protein, partial [Pseudomonadota bacterium]
AAEGLLETRRGAGTFIASEAQRFRELATATTPLSALAIAPQETPDADSATAPIDFRPCRPSTAAFPLNVWQRCLSSAGRRSLAADYGDARGEASLRQVILDYLRRTRGLAASLDNILISNGSVHAMQLAAACFLEPKQPVYFENPGYPLARQSFASVGGRIVPVAVDDDGLMVHRLPRRSARGLVYVTPSHQFPTGGRLALGRRHDLLDWAIRQGALIVEDDYAGEFRFDVAPLAPLAALAPSHVLYCGTFSKTLFPGLRLGFAVGPSTLINAMAKRRAVTEYAPSAPTQLALTEFIDAGHFERHVHRMRRRYRKKRAQLCEALAQHADRARVHGIDSGLHAFVRLRQGQGAAELSRRGATKGVAAPPIGRYDVFPEPRDDGLILGYAAPESEQIAAGVAALLA